MEGKQISVPKQFFKVMMPGFRQQLNLPPVVSEGLRDHISRSVTLKSRTGAWRVSLGRNNETGLVCFQQGWSEFVERHDLTMGEFVFFEHAGDLRFNFSMFDINMCAKEFDDEEVKEDLKKEEEVTETLTTEEAAEEIPFFEKIIQPSHSNNTPKLNIPVKFLRANNLYGRRHMRVALRDPEGTPWMVVLSADSTGGVRFRMRKGWHHFYVANRLKCGDRCVFLLNRRLVTPTMMFFDVKIYRRGNSSEPIYVD